MMNPAGSTDIYILTEYCCETPVIRGVFTSVGVAIEMAKNLLYGDNSDIAITGYWANYIDSGVDIPIQHLLD